MTKKDIYKDAKVFCTCGASFDTRSTKENIYVEVCSQCHPVYVGKQNKTKKTGRVEAFNRKYGLDE